MTLGTDSGEYGILSRAAELVKDVDGLICEIGTREGGSMQIIIDALVNTGQSRHVISIDPYGNIPYQTGQFGVARYDYTNDMKNRAYSALFEYIKGKPINLIPMNITDEVFMRCFSGGVPVYDQEERIINRYALAFLDGPHDFESVAKQIRFFAPRMKNNAIMVFDDIEFPDMNFGELKKILLDHDFESQEIGIKKASFRKIRSVYNYV